MYNYYGRNNGCRKCPGLLHRPERFSHCYCNPCGYPEYPIYSPYYPDGQDYGHREFHHDDRENHSRNYIRFFEQNIERDFHDNHNDYDYDSYHNDNHAPFIPYYGNGFYY